MKNWLFTLIAVLVAGVLLAITRHDSKPMQKNEAGAKGFVLMELFTSQGCSSCPPADDLLGEYAEKNDSNIIPIAFHVDYWNKLGWLDSFSNHQFTERQEKYDADFLHADVYTPQLIINGQKEMVGSEKAAVKKAIANALKEEPAVKINVTNVTENNSSVQLNYLLDGNISNTTLNVALVQHKTITQVKAGENDGSTLRNYNVIRLFKSYAAMSSGTVELALPVGIDIKEFSVVLFVQNDSSGKVIGANKKDL